MAGALGTTADAMSSALDASASSFGAVSDSIDKLYSDANDGATTVADELDRQATAIGKQTEKYTEIRNTLAGILGNDSSIITAIDRSIARQNRAAASAEYGGDRYSPRQSGRGRISMRRSRIWLIKRRTVLPISSQISRPR